MRMTTNREDFASVAVSTSVLFYVLIATNPYVYAVESPWWGLSKNRRTIQWMKTSDYDFPCWMTKNKDGDFYCYIQEEVYFPEEEDYVFPY